MLWPEQKQERLYWWGWSQHGQCGVRATCVPLVRAPSELTSAGPLRDAAASAFDSVVVDHRGAVWHCGKGANSPDGAPLRVPVGAKALRVAAGRCFAAAVLIDGRVACWGVNDQQQCGVAEPPVVPMYSPSFPAIDGVVAVACGASFVVAVRADGSVYTWGALLRATLPVVVKGVAAVACATGDHHALLLDRAGRASSWGVSETGRLGRGGNAAAPGRVRFDGGASITKIAAGGATSAAVDNRGLLWTWGCNGSGQLGLGDREDRDRPAKTAFSNCAAVALGEDHAVAVDADGAVWAWGASRAGRLARDDAPDGSAVPLRVDIVDVARVAAGGAHSLAWVGAKPPARAPGEQLARAVASRDRVDAAAAATTVASTARDASTVAVRAADAATDVAFDRAAAADATRRLIAEKRRAAAAARKAADARKAAAEAAARRAVVVPAPPTPVSPPSPPAPTPPSTPPLPAQRPDWDSLRAAASRDEKAAARALRLADSALRRRSSGSFSGWSP